MRNPTKRSDIKLLKKLTEVFKALRMCFTRDAMNCSVVALLGRSLGRGWCCLNGTVMTSFQQSCDCCWYCCGCGYCCYQVSVDICRYRLLSVVTSTYWALVEFSTSADRAMKKRLFVVAVGVVVASVVGGVGSCCNYCKCYYCCCYC